MFKKISFFHFSIFLKFHFFGSGFRIVANFFIDLWEGSDEFCPEEKVSMDV